MKVNFYRLNENKSNFFSRLYFILLVNLIFSFKSLMVLCSDQYYFGWNEKRERSLLFDFFFLLLVYLMESLAQSCHRDMIGFFFTNSKQTYFVQINKPKIIAILLIQSADNFGIQCQLQSKNRKLCEKCLQIK